ncbi:MAG: hypothetical protein JNJ73_11945 [Hyphomonadaceae bacterium]|nr:hypothetical protein [Hyphomonadaceae bacterium]
MRIVSADDAAREIARVGGRIAVQGGPAEPTPLIEAWRRAPETAAGLSFCGLFIPNFNRIDYAALHERSALEVFLMSRDFRDSAKAGRVRTRPLGYTDAYRFLMRERIDVGVLNLAPAPGLFLSGSVSADVAPAVFFNARFKVALINAAAPRIDDAVRTPLFNREAFDLVVECAAPFLDAPPERADLDALAAEVAALIEDGDAIQFGIGKLPGALLARLTDRRRLRVRSGLYVDAVLDLLDAGALDPDEPMRGGVAIGAPALYERLAAEPRAHFAPIPRTHGHADLAMIDRFVAVNSALEVDLLGQVNSEVLDGAQVSGIGGALDFVRGARASRGGRAIIALPAEAGGRTRIVPKVEAVSIPRADADIIVTEHGAAHIRTLDLDARAEALIAIAAPAHRAALAEAWRAMRQRF